MTRRRRGRRAHPHAGADLPVPRDARADRGRLRLHREAAALQGQVGQAARSTSRRSRSSRRSCCATSSRRSRSPTATATPFKPHARALAEVRRACSSSTRAGRRRCAPSTATTRSRSWRSRRSSTRAPTDPAAVIELLEGRRPRGRAVRDVAARRGPTREVVAMVIERKTGTAQDLQAARAPCSRRPSTRGFVKIHRSSRSSPARRRSTWRSARRTTRRCRSRSCARRCSRSAKRRRAAAALQGPRRDERRPALRHDDGPGEADAAAGHDRRRQRRPTRSSRC